MQLILQPGASRKFWGDCESPSWENVEWREAVRWAALAYVYEQKKAWWESSYGHACTGRIPKIERGSRILAILVSECASVEGAGELSDTEDILDIMEVRD